jgi:ribonucleoside-diphosphate reductase alpha chain
MPQDSNTNMKVIKRNGRTENVSFDKVLKRLQLLANGRHTNDETFGNPLDIEVIPIAQKVISEIRDGISTRRLDEFAAETCADMVRFHPDYNTMAGRIIISNHQKNNPQSFEYTIRVLYEHKDHLGISAPLIANDIYKIIIENKKIIENMIDYSRDFRIDFFGFKTLENSYFLKAKYGSLTITERPQHLWMRVAIGIHRDDFKAVKETYDLLSLGHLSHATPTLFNSGTPTPQNSSCFLIPMKDSLRGSRDKFGNWDPSSWTGSICWAWDQCAGISQNMGGIGLNVTNMRGKGSMIRSSGRPADGLVPLIQTFNWNCRYINQGGRRNGSCAIYVEPWHCDITEFLDLRKGSGNHNQRAIDLFYALWIPDIFMLRVEEALSIVNSAEQKRIMWSLMCPDQSPGLSKLFGQDFDNLYLEYETKGRFKRQIPIIDLWHQILESQKETGTPYMLYKDHVNFRNNQSNLGTINCSNLCAEIVEYTDPDVGLVAVCNLASVCLNSFVNPDGSFNYPALGHATSVAIQNIDKIIDLNFYPTPETKKSNLLTRPCAVGVQGFQDLLYLVRLPFDADATLTLNHNIFETMYYYATKTSVQLAKEKGPYPAFPNSPASKGKFQFDLFDDHVDYWNKRFPNKTLAKKTTLSNMYDWDSLRNDMIKYGLRNSLLLANMPTASSAQIQGNIEAFEPITNNLYVRRVLSGEFKCVNKYLQKDLIKLGLYTPDLQNELVKHRGSVQKLNIPQDLKDLYKTSFEIKQRRILQLSSERSPFIDQSQSLNVFVADPNNSILSSIHLTGWKYLLKTGMYYLRRNPIENAVQFTVDAEKSKKEDSCSRNDPNCIACSS